MDNCCGASCHCHQHEHTEARQLNPFVAPGMSFVMLVAGILFSHFKLDFFCENPVVEIVWYLLAFLPVGWEVMKEAFEGILAKDFFNEFTLMSVASIGAFLIGEYPEGVGVMLFYCIGETLQDKAVDRARRNISRLLDLRGDSTHVIRDGRVQTVDPKTVEIGETIEVRPGERVPLDGIIEGHAAVFDTSALTGESVPREIEPGGEVLAGMLSSSSTVKIKVSRKFGESTLSRILQLVDESSERKAKPELFIRKFARFYTPCVMVLAVLLVAIPWIVSLVHPAFAFHLDEWVYRALVFLVISCPCALVISVPLSFFAGIGAASKAGILFKGGNYLEAITKIDAIAFDKTGTLTTGQFSVESIETISLPETDLLTLIASAEAKSSHPLAKAVLQHAAERGLTLLQIDSSEEVAGQGVKSIIDGRQIVVGNLRLFRNEKIAYPSDLDKMVGTVILCAVDGRYEGYVLMGDTLKDDSHATIKELRRQGVNEIMMLSGDKQEIVQSYAERLDIREAKGDLLPQDKLQIIEKVGRDRGKTVAFVGDGMNDAPVLTLSDVGVAMGGLGSDAAIESADVVIQTDKPSLIPVAIKIGRSTLTIVKENIAGAISIKVAILVLGALGIASLWAAVFADVGVALLAVLNSMRLLWKKY